MPKIGAEYVNSRDEVTSPQAEARLTFLARIESVAPEVLVSLREDVLPVFQSNPSALQHWGERWHLADDWLLEHAAATLDTWDAFPRTREMLQFLGYGARHCRPAPDDGRSIVIAQVRELAAPLPRPEPLVLQFLPTLQTWAEFEEHAHERLRQYRDDVERWAAAHDLTPAPEKNAPRRTNDAGLHFEWLVRYQVQGWTHARIATHYGRNADRAKRGSSTVQRALHNAADLICLTLR